MAIETRELHINLKVTVITLADTWSAEELHRTVRDAVDAGHLHIVVNLKAVPEMDMDRAGALDAGSREAEFRGGKLKLAHVTDQVKGALAVQRSMLVMQIFANEAEAVLSFA